jgi:hypothetical protein
MANPASCALRGTDRWRTRVVNARGAAVGPRLPGPAARNGSAYGGAPAAHTRAREVVGAAESDPEPTFNDETSSRRDRAEVYHILPWIEAARLDARNATSSAIPSGDGRHDRLNSELRLRLRNEYASSRVFRGGKLDVSHRVAHSSSRCAPRVRIEASPKRR